MEKKLLDETIELLQKLIQNECVNPPGNEMKSILTIKEFLERKDIECKVYKSEKNRGNLIARIKGSAIGPSMMFGPSHVDVVPIEKPDEWIVPPFSGEIKDGYVWGRGSFDMLFIVAAQCQAFAMLHTEGFKPKGDLILCIVADEEAGGVKGAKWMIENHPDEMKTDYAVSEFGGLQTAKNRLILSYGEKGVVGIKVTFKGQSGHASMPYGVDNSVLKMAEAIQRVNKYKVPFSTKYLKHLAKGLGLGFFQRTLITNKIFLPIALRILEKISPTMVGPLHAMSRTTFSPTIVRAGQKINVFPGKSEFEIDCRLLPGQDYNYAIKHIKKALGRKLAKEVEISLFDSSPKNTGTTSPLDNDFVKAIEKVYKKFNSNYEIVPVIAYGATDLRFIRHQGGNGYGFSLIDPETPNTEITKMAHNINERIRITSIELTTKAMFELAKEFLG